MSFDAENLLRQIVRAHSVNQFRLMLDLVEEAALAIEKHETESFLKGACAPQAGDQPGTWVGQFDWETGELRELSSSSDAA